VPTTSLQIAVMLSLTKSGLVPVLARFEVAALAGVGGLFRSIAKRGVRIGWKVDVSPIETVTKCPRPREPRTLL